MEQKHIKDISSIAEEQGGIRVDITSGLESDLAAVEKIVENCAAGACDCMKPEVKARVTGMDFVRENGGAAIHIKGNITAEEIKETMERSQVEFGSSSCCSSSDEKGSSCC